MEKTGNLLVGKVLIDTYLHDNPLLSMQSKIPVSYTHLDVYKRQVLRVATDDITERLYDLLQGERVVARIDQNVVYRSLAEDPANIYSLDVYKRQQSIF